MMRIILIVKDNNYLLFMELLKNLEFVEIKEDAGEAKKEIILHLTKGI